MSEYIIHYKDAETLYEHRDFPFLLEEYLREEIVRCRDCKYGHEVYWPTSFGIPDDYLDCTGPLVTTWDEYHDQPKDNPVRPDGFCAWGERRSE